MTETTIGGHGLNEFIGLSSSDYPQISMTVRSDLAAINLRGNADNATFVAAVENALGQKLPVAANTISSAARDIFWLGPDEWLVLAAETEIDSLTIALEKALDDSHAAINVINGGQVVLALSGDNVREVLAKGCTIDFHPREFQDGTCVQSGLAKASVVIGKPGNDDQFIVIVRRSFSDYLLRWLVDASVESGIRIVES